MSTDDYFENMNALVRFSNRMRKKANVVYDKKTFKRKNSLFEHFVFDYIPGMMASTILSPLNRIKVILQVNYGTNLTSKEVYNGIIKNEGYKALFKGNIVYSIKLFFQFSIKTLFYERIKYRFKNYQDLIKKQKLKIYFLDFFINFLSATTSSLICLVFTFPFDMAYTRMAAEYNCKKFYYKNMSDSFEITNTQRSVLRYLDYYPGFRFALLQQFVNSTISLLGYSMLHFLININKNEKPSSINNYKYFIIGPFFVSFIASIITYPFDTIKRLMQTSGAKGFRKLRSIEVLKEFSINPLRFYSGFYIYLLRSLPYSFLQYQIFNSLVSVTTK